MSAPFFTYATNVTVADAVVFVKVPTAKLSVAAVDDYGKPIDIYVTEVRLGGPSRLNFTKPPKDVEVLAGVYDVDVIAVGRWGTTRVRLAPRRGQDHNRNGARHRRHRYRGVAKPVGLAGVPPGIRRRDGD